MDLRLNQQAINVLFFAMILALFFLAFSNRIDIYNLKIAVQKVGDMILDPFWRIGG